MAEIVILQLRIADIVRDPTLQPREKINQSTVLDYAEALKDGDEFPPVKVFRVGGKYMLAAGWHRLFGHVEAKRKCIDAEVYDGTLQDAIVAAAGDNAKHGLQRTSEDKRRAVRMFLLDDELRKTPDREIGRICHIRPNTVGQWRREWQAEWRATRLSVSVDTDAPRTVTRAGKTFPMKVAGLQEKEKAAIERRQREDATTAHERIGKSLVRIREELEELEPERRSWEFPHDDGGWTLRTKARWGAKEAA